MPPKKQKLDLTMSPKEKNKLSKIIDAPMGDNDIRKYFPDVKIIKYSDLIKYESLDELLPKEQDAVFILYQDSPNSGHWTLTIRNGNQIQFFDSYGGEPDSQLRWLPERMRQQLKTNVPYLTNLFNKSNFDIVYNPIKYQSEKKTYDINTCGRHCSLRLKTFLNGKTLNQYYQDMKKIKKITGGSYDDIVSVLIEK